MSKVVDLSESWTRWLLPSDGHHVYILRAVDGMVIYVGRSSNVCRRVYQHEMRWWWQLVATVEVRRCTDLAAAHRLECALIRDLDPVANVAGSPSKVA